MTPTHDVPSIQALEAMEKSFYGYGQWSAPFWFVGPEQGVGKSESDTSTARLRAWKALHEPDICDCFEFHEQIPDLMGFTGKPPLQGTWRSLLGVAGGFGPKVRPRFQTGFIRGISGDGPTRVQRRVSLSYLERHRRDCEAGLIAKPDSSQAALSAFARRLRTTTLVWYSCTERAMPLIGPQSLGIR